MHHSPLSDVTKCEHRSCTFCENPAEASVSSVGFFAIYDGALPQTPCVTMHARTHARTHAHTQQAHMLMRMCT